MNYKQYSLKGRVTLKNVLIITYSFPPLNNIAARRFGEMVKYMEQNRWKPYIVTTNCQGMLDVTLPEKQCMRIGKHPQTFTRIDSIDLSLNSLPNILERTRQIFGKVNFRFRAVDRAILTWGLSVKNETDTIMKKFPCIDLVLATFGPSASLWLGQWFAYKYQVPWIADFRDLAALRKDDRTWLAYIIDRIIERKLLSKCSGFTTVSEHLSDLISGEYGRRCQTIYNGYDRLPKVQTKIADTTYIYYAGRFYNHRMEAVYKLLNALTRFRHVGFKVRSLGPLELENKIIDYASTVKVKDRIEILPPVNPDIVEWESQHAIANVVFEDMDTSNQWSAGTLTGKFLQLLPYAAPIVAIARPDNEMGKILELTKRGALCSTVSQIEAFLIKAKYEQSYFLGNKSAVSEFSKEKQTKLLCSYFDEILKTRTKSAR